jgi:hypothetical protein
MRFMYDTMVGAALLALCSMSAEGADENAGAGGDPAPTPGLAEPASDGISENNNVTNPEADASDESGQAEEGDKAEDTGSQADTAE